MNACVVHGCQTLLAFFRSSIFTNVSVNYVSLLKYDSIVACCHDDLLFIVCIFNWWVLVPVNIHIEIDQWYIITCDRRILYDATLLHIIFKIATCCYWEKTVVKYRFFPGKELIFTVHNGFSRQLSYYQIT